MLKKLPEYYGFDCDTKDEYLYESKIQNIYVKPSAGGTIFEWDMFKINQNILDTLTRRYESYHKSLEKIFIMLFLQVMNNKKSRLYTVMPLKLKKQGLINIWFMTTTGVRLL